MPDGTLSILILEHSEQKSAQNTYDEPFVLVKVLEELLKMFRFLLVVSTRDDLSMEVKRKETQ